MNENWKNIDGFENLYQISNYGNVKSLKCNKEKILKPINKDGYLFVHLYKDGERKKYYIHRLVASAFIKNPNNLPQVNHKDENPINNNIENLEWCDCKYNINYGTHNERARKGKINHPSLSKSVYSVNKTTNEVTYYQSAIDAERITGIFQSSICSCLKGKLKSAGGRYWYYAS